MNKQDRVVIRGKDVETVGRASPAVSITMSMSTNVRVQIGIRREEEKGGGTQAGVWETQKLIQALTRNGRDG